MLHPRQTALPVRETLRQAAPAQEHLLRSGHLPGHQELDPVLLPRADHPHAAAVRRLCGQQAVPPVVHLLPRLGEGDAVAGAGFCAGVRGQDC